MKDQKGSNNYASKYTDEQIKRVCEMIAEGKSVLEITTETQVGYGTVVAIRNKNMWTHISCNYDFPEVVKKPRASQKLSIKFANYWRKIIRFLFHKLHVILGLIEKP